MMLANAAALIAQHVPAAPCADEVLKTLQQANVVYVTNDYGIAVALYAADEADLLWIVAHPPRHGHGADLMQRLYAVLRHQHIATLWLEVAQSNIAAQALYQRFGGIVLGQRKAYYTHVFPAEDALLMRCILWSNDNPK